MRVECYGGRGYDLDEEGKPVYHFSNKIKAKAKIRFVKFEKGLAMQVLEMDERFRSNGDQKYYISYRTGGVIIVSRDYPDINFSGEKAIFLWGLSDSDDDNVVVEKFTTNKKRDTCVEEIVKALKLWADEWYGFSGSRYIILPHDTEKDDFILEV